MHLEGLPVGAILIVVVCWGAFKTVVLPGRLARLQRITRAFHRVTWRPWRAVARLVPAGTRRENFFSVAQSGLSPDSMPIRVFTIVESGTGLGFLAMVIAYIPTFSQAFSRREVNVALLGSRAGSPPSAEGVLVRHVELNFESTLPQLIAQWEQWSADVLETHLSFPLLIFYRSQHKNQSWVAALTTILDVCALVIAGNDPRGVAFAHLAFEMARNAAVQLSVTAGLTPLPPATDRLPASDLAHLRRSLRGAGLPLPDDQETDERLLQLRRMYEPYVNALSEFLLMPLPLWSSVEGAHGNSRSLHEAGSTGHPANAV
jgi:hypothetical protein